MACDNITELVKKELLIVQGVVDTKTMDAEERTDFLEEVHKLAENEVLYKIMDSILSEQKQATISFAETEKQLWAGRASLLGLVQLKEELSKLNEEWKKEHDKDIPFDKYSVV